MPLSCFARPRRVRRRLVRSNGVDHPPWALLRKRVEASGFQQAPSSSDPRVCLTLDHGHEAHLRDLAQNIRTCVACHESRRALRHAALAVVAPVDRSRLVRFSGSCLLGFYAPLATSVSKSGSRASPGIFRPWAFSTLRRLTPSTHRLSCFIQAPPMRFKEQYGSSAFLVSWSAHPRDIPPGTEGTNVQMTEVICVGQSLLVAAPFSPSISPSRLDTAPMRHSLGSRGRELRRRAHRHAGSLRIDHVKGRPSPQLAATSPSSEVRSDGHRSDRRPFLSLSLLRLCLRQKNDPVTKNLRPPFPARSSELLPPFSLQFHKDQPPFLPLSSDR